MRHIYQDKDLIIRILVYCDGRQCSCCQSNRYRACDSLSSVSTGKAVINCFNSCCWFVYSKKLLDYNYVDRVRSNDKFNHNVLVLDIC